MVDAPASREQGFFLVDVQPDGGSNNDGTRNSHQIIHELLDLLVKQNGSDLFITADFPR